MRTRKILLPTLSFSLALLMAVFASSARAQDDNGPPDPTANNPGNAADVGPATATGPTSSVSFQQFYDQLSPYGSWINTDKYGYVFQPTETDPNWAPYTYGHWVNTNDGMVWVGDDPFSWATDHYGRWVNLDGTGWAWVPGYTWSPAWVSWRETDDGQDVGWAPLPPDSDLGIDYYGDDYWDWGWPGFHIGGDCDLVYGIGPWWYNFCPVAYFGDRYCWRHFHHRGDNFGLVGHSRNLTNLNFRRDGHGRFGHVTAGGPSVAALNARAHTPIQTVNLARASTLNNAGLHGGTLSVFAPQVNPATRGTARPTDVAHTIGHVAVNHGTDINHGLAVNPHLGATAATAAEIRGADQARGDFARARGATDASHFTHNFGGSLNTLRTTPNEGAAFHANATHAPAGMSTPSGISRGSVFAGEGSPRVFSTPRTTRVYGDSPAGSEFRSYRSTPAFSYRSYHAPSYSYRSSTPSFRSYSAPSFHSYSAPHFSGGYSGGGHFGGGGYSGGGHYGGGGGFSGGGRGGGGHR